MSKQNLDHLFQGLYEVAMTVRQKEIREFTQQLTLIGGLIPTIVFMSNHYGRLVESLFDWFLLSLCNYLCLIDIVSQHHWDFDQKPLAKRRDRLNTWSNEGA